MNSKNIVNNVGMFNDIANINDNLRKKNGMNCAAIRDILYTNPLVIS